MGPGLLAANLTVDGPYEAEAALWIEEKICEGCFAEEPYDDGLGARCIRALEDQADRPT